MSIKIVNTPLAGDQIITKDFAATDRFQAFLDEIEKLGNEDMSTDPMLEISKGNVQGTSFVNIFGSTVRTPDGVEELIWTPGGDYTFSTTADITHIVSSVAETQQIWIKGLDANWNEITQTKTLTGTTGVALDTPLIRVFKMRVDSPTLNAGVVQCGVGAVTSAFTAVNLRAQIEIGAGQSLMALYTVPAGKTAYLTKYYGSIIGSVNKPSKAPPYAVFRLCTIDRANNYARRIDHILAASLAGTSVVEHNLLPYPGGPEKTDVFITGLPDGGDGEFAGGFDLIIVDAP